MEITLGISAEKLLKAVSRGIKVGTDFERGLTEEPKGYFTEFDKNEVNTDFAETEDNCIKAMGTDQNNTGNAFIVKEKAPLDYLRNKGKLCDNWNNSDDLEKKRQQFLGIFQKTVRERNKTVFSNQYLGNTNVTSQEEQAVAEMDTGCTERKNTDMAIFKNESDEVMNENVDMGITFVDEQGNPVASPFVTETLYSGEDDEEAEEEENEELLTGPGGGTLLNADKKLREYRESAVTIFEADENPDPPTVNEDNLPDFLKRGMVETEDTADEDFENEEIEDEDEVETEETADLDEDETVGEDVVYNEGMTLVQFLKANKSVRDVEQVLNWFTKQQIQAAVNNDEVLIKRGKIII